MSFPKQLPMSYWLTHRALPIPKVITFDAYNTLYCALVPVMEQYSLEAQKGGVRIPAETLAARFPGVFKSVKERYPNYGKYNGLTADQWWYTLIKELFHGTHISDSIIHSILDRFKGREAYGVYPDVLHFLQFMRKNHPNTVIGIISNTDPNVYQLLENLGILEYFKGFTYFSYELEMSKPSQKIFDHVIDDVMKKRPELFVEESVQVDVRKGCWHVGDEWKNDLLAAKEAGWNSVLVDRANIHGCIGENSIPNKEMSEHEVAIQKVNQKMPDIWEFCKNKDNAVQLDNKTFVVPNIYCFKSFFF